MNFSYKIENYIPTEKRLFVVYQPEDNTLLPYGGWVVLNDGMTEAEIRNQIIQSVPIYKWEITPDPLVESIVGSTDSFAYAPPVVSHQQIDVSANVRSIRNMKLSASDWTQLPDAPLSEEEKALWAIYRQALRDVTQQEGFPNNVTWPVSPSSL